MDDAPSRKDIPYSYCPVTQRRGIWPVRQAAKTWHFQKLIRTILSLINSFPNNDQKKKKKKSPGKIAINICIWSMSCTFNGKYTDPKCFFWKPKI